MTPSRTAYAWTLVFFVSLATLTVGSLLPAARLPDIAFDVWDKAQHAVGFAWLMLSGLLAFTGRFRPALVAAFLFAWGGLIEVLQSWSGWRQGDVIDFLADGIGILVVWWLWSVAAPGRKASVC